MTDNNPPNAMLPAMLPSMVRALEIDAALEEKIAPQGDNENSIEYSRRHYAEKRAFWNQDKPKIREIIDKPVPTRHGEVACRFYYNGDKDAPVLFYIHGGGFVVGNLDTHDRIMRLHANHGHCNVIGINYSKAPEHKCPEAADEVEDVVRYCFENADDLGLRRDKFCLSGDSAGAHLSLNCMLRLRDSKFEGGAEVKIAAALLYYGNYGLLDSPSVRKYGTEDYGLAWQVMEFYKNSYLAEPAQAFDPIFNLLMNEMHDLPPLLIVGLTLDPLSDDSRVLAEKIKSAGGICKYSEYHGVLHGCMHYSKTLPEAYLIIGEGVCFMWNYLRDYENYADMR